MTTHHMNSDEALIKYDQLGQEKISHLKASASGTSASIKECGGDKLSRLSPPFKMEKMGPVTYDNISTTL